MKIKENIEKIPGGMMVVPLALGAGINELFPWDLGDLLIYNMNITILETCVD